MKPETTYRPDIFGPAMGFITFCSGVGLLALTFKLAFDLFTIPPEQALGVGATKTVDLTQTGQSFGWIIVRILLLLVMAAVGSMIANRGIRLYVSSRHASQTPIQKNPDTDIK